MREIKFRAWDKQTGDWLHLNTESTEWYNKRTGVFREFFDKHVHLMQYTGLKDKNGQEIYEGDIIRFYDSLVSSFLVGVVDFKDGSFVIVSDGATHYRWMDYDLEVIGNIYENKELLSA